MQVQKLFYYTSLAYEAMILAGNFHKEQKSCRYSTKCALPIILRNVETARPCKAQRIISHKKKHAFGYLVDFKLGMLQGDFVGHHA